jgi:hypothetical protein
VTVMFCNLSVGGVTRLTFGTDLLFHCAGFWLCSLH